MRKLLVTMLDPSGGQDGMVPTVRNGAVHYETPPTSSGGSAAGDTTGSDTTLASATYQVAAAKSSLVVGLSLGKLGNDMLLTMHATAHATAPSGTQGAYIDPTALVVDVQSGQNLTAPGASSDWQWVQTPLAADLHGTAVCFLLAGYTYKLAYNLKAGTGAPSPITFTNVQATYRLTPL